MAIMLPLKVSRAFSFMKKLLLEIIHDDPGLLVADHFLQFLIAGLFDSLKRTELPQ